MWDPADGPMPPWMRYGKRRPLKPLPMPRQPKGRRCRERDCRTYRRESCKCDRCTWHCHALCRDRTQRAESGCGHCAWCLACGARFPFATLTIAGPDLCPACLRGD